MIRIITHSTSIKSLRKLFLSNRNKLTLTRKFASENQQQNIEIPPNPPTSNLINIMRAIIFIGGGSLYIYGCIFTWNNRHLIKSVHGGGEGETAEGQAKS